jgi:transposase
MKVLHARCAGLDVHKQTVVACARLQEGAEVRRELQRFATTTQGLLQLLEWLLERGVTHVAMEATGVYWKPVWHVLEGQVELLLANAAHVRNVPGRKSDTNDATWLADLLAHGLGRSVPRSALSRGSSRLNECLPLPSGEMDATAGLDPTRGTPTRGSCPPS